MRSQTYASEIRRVLQLALDGATRDGVKRIEAISAMLSLALDVLAIEMPLAEAKQFIRDQLELVCASRAAFGETQQHWLEPRSHVRWPPLSLAPPQRRA